MILVHNGDFTQKCGIDALIWNILSSYSFWTIGWHNSWMSIVALDVYETDWWMSTASLHRSKNVTTVICLLVFCPFFNLAYQIPFIDTPVAWKGYSQIMYKQAPFLFRESSRHQLLAWPFKSSLSFIQIIVIVLQLCERKTLAIWLLFSSLLWQFVAKLPPNGLFSASLHWACDISTPLRPMKRPITYPPTPQGRHNQAVVSSLQFSASTHYGSTSSK